MNMEKGDAWLIAGAAGSMLALGFSLYYPHWAEENRALQLASGMRARVQTETAAEPRPMSLEETVSTILPTLESADREVRRTALEAVLVTLKERSAETLGPETRQTLAQSLIAAYGNEPEDKEGLELRSAAFRTLVSQVGGEEAREFAAHALSTGADAMRVEALKALLDPAAVRGGRVSEEALKLARSPTVPGPMKPAALRRFLGKKSQDEILDLFAGEEASRETLAACAVELQNLHKPELMGVILTRLDRAGLLADVKRLPWMSGKLLSAHIRAAEGDELVQALKVVWLRPTLTRSTMKSVEVRLAHADPRIRRMVARLIPDAVKYKGIESAQGEELLTARLQTETDPEVKGELEGSLAQVRQSRQPQPGPEAPVPAAQ